MSNLLNFNSAYQIFTNLSALTKIQKLLIEISLNMTIFGQVTK